MSKKVSVIVPVFNVEDYLPQCLDSLVSQTLEEIEILVINDGSTDQSQKIIDDYAKHYPSMIRAFEKSNGGLSETRNYGVGLAEGEYIAFVDSDDYVSKDMLSVLYAKATEHDSDVVVCDFCKFTDKKTWKTNLIKSTEKYPCSVEQHPEILFECKSFACNKLFKRKWYMENGFEFPKGRWFEDSAAVYNMLYLANHIDAVTDSLYYYRVDREGSITNTINDKIFDIFHSCKSIHDFYYSHTQNRRVLDAADRLCQVHMFVRMDELLSRGSVQMKLAFYNAMLKFFHEYIPNWSQNPYYPDPKRAKKLWGRIRHIPWLARIYLCIPGKIKRVLKALEKSKKHSADDCYINRERLRELQLIELDILKEIDRICRKNQLTYYLGEGSLLGAMRHQGFIPWDDDLDILMPREDYEKFRTLAPNQLDKRYLLLCEQNEPKYYLPFTKVFSAENYGFISQIEAFDPKYSGPFVDIFPLDYADTVEPAAVEKKYRRIRKIRDELLLKAGFIKPNSKKRKLYNIESKFHSYEKLHEKLRQEVLSADSSAPYMCNFASSYHPSRQLVPKEVYGAPRYVPFEDGEFPVPQDAEALLTAVYGNYKKMPPVRKRISKHSFRDLRSEKTMHLTRPQETAEMEEAALAEVHQLQQIELGILKEVDRVCREHHIPYYLGEGTLLGAIRHQGFIPWDDDVDIVMFREDLERFMKICDSALKPNFKLQYYHNIDQYWVQSPKVRLLDQTDFQQSALRKYTADVGPYIDIFPLDYAPSSLIKLWFQEKYIKAYRRVLFLKTGFSRPKNLKQRVLKLYAKTLSVKAIHEKIRKMATRYNRGNRKYVTNFGSYYSAQKETFPTIVFGEPVYVPFEDGMFPVPQDAEFVLKTTYGNYRELPPENKRIAKHNFQ